MTSAASSCRTNNNNSFKVKSAKYFGSQLRSTLLEHGTCFFNALIHCSVLFSKLLLHCLQCCLPLGSCTRLPKSQTSCRDTQCSQIEGSASSGERSERDLRFCKASLHAPNVTLQCRFEFLQNSRLVVSSAFTKFFNALLQTNNELLGHSVARDSPVVPSLLGQSPRTALATVQIRLSSSC
ncbi:MAG: hypothetical protein MHM6MM_002420 [Cercozoa sp. M6MM]